MFVAEEMTQADAQSFCQYGTGTDLATIDSDSKSLSMHEIMSEQHADKAWIGLMKQNGSWKWIDGTLCSSYLSMNATVIDCSQDTNWAAAEPNLLPDENCATVGDHHGGSYNNIECWKKFVSFCNYDNNSSIIAFDNMMVMVTNGDDNNKDGYLDTKWIIMIAILCMICVIVIVGICMRLEGKEQNPNQRHEYEQPAMRRDDDTEDPSSETVPILSLPPDALGSLSKEAKLQLREGQGVYAFVKLDESHDNTTTNPSSTGTDPIFDHSHLDSQDNQLEIVKNDNEVVKDQKEKPIIMRDTYEHSHLESD